MVTFCFIVILADVKVTLCFASIVTSFWLTTFSNCKWLEWAWELENVWSIGKDGCDKSIDTFSIVEPCRFMVTLNLLLVPFSLVVVSCWAMMSIVAIFSMLLDVTTFGTSTPSRVWDYRSKWSEVYHKIIIILNLFSHFLLFITCRWRILPCGAMGMLMNYLFNNNI